MRYAVDVAPLGDFSDPSVIVDLARAAEAAGWDGVSTWDVLGVSMGGAADPFVTLAGAAAVTERLTLILSVVALPRRRPQLVAQSTASLDALSHGRLVLGVGAGGDPADFEAFGEAYEPAERIARLDEGLAILDGFLRGERIDHHGDHYRVNDTTLGPRPRQQPRPPIWFGGGARPGALRRAARWDGWIAVSVTDDGSEMNLSPAAFGAMVGRLGEERAAAGRAGESFDIAVFGFSAPSEADVVAAYGAAGATWWLGEPVAPARVARRAAGPRRGGSPDAVTTSVGSCGFAPLRVRLEPGYGGGRVGQSPVDVPAAVESARPRSGR